MTTKNIFKTSMLALALTSTLTGCMNLEPKDSMGDNLVWTTEANFELFANQFYSWTRDFGGYSADYQNGYSNGVHSDYRSDIICTSTQNTYSMGTNSAPETDANFTTLYKRIYYTNLLLKNAEGRDDVDQPKGEALWFRAYLYFELVQIYGDCQLVLTPLDITSGELYGERDDRTTVIDQCIDDLEEAVGLLPETPTEEGRLCKAAAWALMSRIALYEGTWQKFHTGNGNNTELSKRLLTQARISSERVIEYAENGMYSIFSDEGLKNTGINEINQSYRYMFILEDADCNPAKLQKSANKEYILAHRHRLGDKLAVNMTHGCLGNVVYITRKLANMFLCSDGLPIEKSTLFKGYTGATDEFQNRDARMDNDMLWHGEQYWNNDSKWRTAWDNNDLASCLVANARSNSGYQNQKWGSERELTDYYESYDYPVIRYAEIILNYTEAIYELEGEIEDETGEGILKYFNQVRKRVNPNMPTFTSKFVRENGLDMREEIRRERTIELYLEGFRIDDLKRWKTADTEMPEDQLGVKMTGTWFGTNWTGQSRSLSSDGCIIMYTGRTWADRNYLYPLPSDQRQLNPNLGQNPGW